jgi:NAD(P)-dependent dehydrogenase (short-subunit alcohol dehydrogenase family)
MKRIVVIDGMGGGIGAALVEKICGRIKAEGSGAELIALGANSGAAERMLRAGAQRGASGENAVIVSVNLGDYILGPIGIILPNSMMGEISPAMAQAVLAARGERILLPLENHFYIAGMENKPLAKLIEDAVERLFERINANA